MADQQQRLNPGQSWHTADYWRSVSRSVRTIRVQAELNDRSFWKQFRLMAARARGETIRIDVDADTNRIGRTTSMLGALGGALKSLMGLGSGAAGVAGRGRSKLLPNFGSGMNLPAMVVVLGAVTAVAAPLIGLIAGALLTLPGLATLALAPIAALALGFEGMQKAAETIKQPFEELKTLMSDTVQKQFTPVFAELAKSFPMLERAMPVVSRGMADLARGIAQTVNKNGPMLEDTFRNIGNALTQATPGMNDFVEGFIRLAHGFSTKLPSIVQWFNDLGDRFNRFIQSMAEGDFSQFDNLGHTLRGIVDTILEWSKIGLDFLGDDEKMRQFLSVLSDVKQALTDLVELSNDIGTAWETIFGMPDGGLWGMPDVDFDNSPIGKLLGRGDKQEGPSSVGGSFDVEGGAEDQVKNLKEQIDQVKPSAEQSREALKDLLIPPAEGGAPGAVPGQEVPGVPPEVKPPDTTKAKEEIAQYQTFVSDVTNQVKGALEQATTGETLPAPNFTAFKAAWSELPGHVTKSVSDVRNAAVNGLRGIEVTVQTTGTTVVSEVQSWPGRIAAALAGLYLAGVDAGNQLTNGLIAGINAGIPGVQAAARAAASAAAAAARAELDINSPSRVFEEIGMYTMKGFDKGMKGGYGEVLGTAKDMAGKVSKAFADNSDPTRALSGYSTQDIDRAEKALEFETKRLESKAKALDYEASLTGDKAMKDRLKAQADEIRNQKEQLSLQKEMIELANEYNEASDLETSYGKAIGGALGIPVDMAEAAGDQFISDLGFSTSGLLPTLLTEGTKYIFNVNGVDEALAVQQRQQNKEALEFTRR
ncbi:tape measure protein [Gordonia phage Anon]|nr:tape measure protein [Gordonia phage Anon]